MKVGSLAKFGKQCGAELSSRVQSFFSLVHLDWVYEIHQILLHFGQILHRIGDHMQNVGVTWHTA
jgi:hypothetical protein